MKRIASAAVMAMLAPMLLGLGPAAAGAEEPLDPLLRILVRKGTITLAEAREVQQERDEEIARQRAKTTAQAAQGETREGGAKVDYEFGKGVTFEKGDMNLNVAGRIQVQYDAAQEDAGVLKDAFGTSRESDKETFDVRRARVTFKGDLSDVLGYYFQFDVSDDAELKDAVIAYKPFTQFQIMGGQFKVPFGREWLNSSGNLEFVGRSIVNRFFQLGHDVGVAVGGRSPGKGQFHYEAGVWNGEGEGSDNVDGKFLAAARAGWDPFGYFKPSQGDIKRSEAPKFSVAANGFRQEFDGGDQEGWGLDFAYQQRGLSLEGEWDTSDRNVDGASEKFSADGWRLQVGYMIYRHLIELAARYAELKADFPEGFVAGAPGRWDDLVGSDGVIYNDLAAYTIALSFYFEGHASKLQLDYTWLDENSDTSPDAPNLDNDVFRVQYQVKF